MKNFKKLVGVSLSAMLFSVGVDAQTVEQKKEKLPYNKKELLKGKDQKSWGFFNNDFLVARAVLPAATFAPGPTSGQYLGGTSFNGQTAPFYNKQPIQGFSSILLNADGTFTALSDNGFGSAENSADYNLRLYTISPNFKYSQSIGSGTIDVIGHIELRDPNKMIDFVITNEFSSERVLTGADFDIESVQRDKNGDFWIGEEFGPYILHFDKNGILLEKPIPLPDFSGETDYLRAPQNHYNEEYSALRVMNAMRAHAQSNGAKNPVMSPWFVMLADEDPSTYVGSRQNPPAELAPASSEIFNLQSLNKAGHPVVVYTVNDSVNMEKQLELGVQGVISDRPDLLLQAVQNFDGDNDGKPDYIDAEGLIDVNLFDAQGHRGARNLRPENTLPSMEAALDYLMPTLETDCGITKDGYAVLDHDPHIEAAKVRMADGTSYEYNDEVLVKNHTLKEIQTLFIADKILNGRPAQTNDLSLSPVSVAFAKEKCKMHPYAMPSLQQLFDFVEFYVAYYKTGKGASHADAEKRWKNASKVRFNIETKINPRTDMDDRGAIFADRTVAPEQFAEVIAKTIKEYGLEDRADIQSFDFRTLLLVQKMYPKIRTVCLFGDFPKVGDKGDGTNLQDQDGANTPWLAGMHWPYRATKDKNPVKVSGSGGFEGMALTTDGTKLLTLLEKPLIDSEEKNLLISEFDLYQKAYTGVQYMYPMNEKGAAIGDFIMFNKKRGVVIERDWTQGDMNGFKAIYEIELGENGEKVKKKLQVDLLKLVDFKNVSLPSLNGDVGVGYDFGFPFVTIESVVVFNPYLIGVLNDNNYPFSVGRHVGSKLPDDNEFILVWLNEPLGKKWSKRSVLDDLFGFKAYPNEFKDEVTFTNDKNFKTIKIDIYSVTGTLVKSIEQQNTTNSEFEFTWNTVSDKGSVIEPGVYFAVVNVDGQLTKKKLIKQ